MPAASSLVSCVIKERDRQTDRDRDRQTERATDRKTNRQTQILIDRQRPVETEVGVKVEDSYLNLDRW